MAEPPELTAHCAICGQDNSLACRHEDERLKIALDEAQTRWIASEKMRVIRHWVLEHARTMVLYTFENLSRQRRIQYQQHLETIPNYNLYQIYQDDSPLAMPQYQQLKSQMRQALDIYQKNLNSDWAISLQQYPKMLDYYFSLVYLAEPDDDDDRVVNPIVGATGGEDKRKKSKKEKAVYRNMPPLPANVAPGYGRYPAPASRPRPGPGPGALVGPVFMNPGIPPPGMGPFPPGGYPRY